MRMRPYDARLLGSAEPSKERSWAYALCSSKRRTSSTVAGLSVQRRIRGMVAEPIGQGAFRPSFHGNTLRQVARLINIAAAQQGDMVGQQLQRHHGHQRL